MDNIPKVTLDTNLLIEYWKKQSKYNVVKQLLQLVKGNKIDLAVAARVYEDIPESPLADEIYNLQELDVEVTGSVTRLGYWELGRDILGDESLKNYFESAEDQARQLLKRFPDWRGQDNIHAHFILGRDAFLTWDRAILDLATDLKERFNIIIMKPENFISNLVG